MKIIIDCMGGDNAPLAPVQGALAAAKDGAAEIVLCGRKDDILSAAGGALPENASLLEASEVVEIADDPATAFRVKKDSSLTVGLTALKTGAADAFVSAGSTGALLAGATLVTKRIKGIRRAAMGPVLPSATGKFILCDCGANAMCTSEYLLQFAYLGSFYMQRIQGIENPRVGLLNIGAESEKGDDLRRETHALLTAAHEAGRLNFVGNVEGTDAFAGKCDVLVADGFSGNVMLKSIEGTAKMLMGKLKGVFYGSTKGKIAGALVRSDLSGMKKLLDPSEVGGTPFLGISKCVIKAHGASDARAFHNAIRRAQEFVESGFIAQVEENIAWMRVENNP